VRNGKTVLFIGSEMFFESEFGRGGEIEILLAMSPSSFKRVKIGFEGECRVEIGDFDLSEILAPKVLPNTF
jgi:hypothetical protein